MNGDYGIEGCPGYSLQILEGLATVVVALIAAVVMVNYPSTVKFLTEEECSFITQKETKKIMFASRFRRRSQMGMYGHYRSSSGPSSFLCMASRSFCRQLLPPVPTPAVYACQRVSGSVKVEPLAQRLGAVVLIALTGYVINISNTPSSIKYFGTFLCVIGSYSAFPGSISWLANNLGGRYKRAVGLAIQIGVGNMGGAIASGIYRTRDEPRYLLGHGLEIMFLGIGIVTLPFTVLAQRTNAKRDLVKSLERDIPLSTHVLVALQ
ncbi:hypothetical protein L210DRAFT_3652589 [Boletus edulis BED1]|uniref:Uncharacterized protein n=1 Tax=Boletus edulis BED1 TaxID=1328754 RepID=A0AAD4BG73_BOLED|nr:hypothetical protein L210DRAFT_3652589 [Boletus edulis BED1]